MAKSIITEKVISSTSEMIYKALGDSKSLWDEIIQQYESVNGSDVQAWKFYGKPWGWTLAFQSKKLKLIFAPLSPKARSCHSFR